MKLDLKKKKEKDPEKEERTCDNSQKHYLKWEKRRTKKEVEREWTTKNKRES